jgi:hypothetical protein
MNTVNESGKMEVDPAQAVFGSGDTQDIGMEDAPAIVLSTDRDPENSRNSDIDNSAKVTEAATFAERYQTVEYRPIS